MSVVSRPHPRTGWPERGGSVVVAACRFVTFAAAVTRFRIIHVDLYPTAGIDHLDAIHIASIVRHPLRAQHLAARPAFDPANRIGQLPAICAAIVATILATTVLALTTTVLAATATLTAVLRQRVAASNHQGGEQQQGEGSADQRHHARSGDFTRQYRTIVRLECILGTMR